MELSEFFAENRRAALAFSGGADSAYLLYAALKHGADVTAYYVKSQFQPEFELRDAERLSRELNAPMRVITLDVLARDSVRENAPNRCYHCKREIMAAVWAAAREDGYGLVIDGANASDDAGDRPGMRAARELAVRSPLRECGITKPQLRRLSREAGLFTWDKPAYACLATRVKTGEAITAEALQKIEASEARLFALGFRDFRVRVSRGGALLQFTGADLPRARAREAELRALIAPYFERVEIDDVERKRGL